jgi:enoyl-CoA hydratase/carnithine racemase
MSNEVLSIERSEGVVVLTMNRPEQKNALNRALLGALGEALAAASKDPAARAIVLTGAGGAFCSGADLKAAMTEGGLDKPAERVEEFHGIIRAIVDAPKPVIAMCEGPAVGFGCDLALACDLRFAGVSAYFQEKFVKIGLMPDGGGTFWLPRLVGLARAMELMLTGEAVSAERALALGLVNRVLPRDTLRDETLRLAHDLAKGPPLAFAEMKRAVRLGLGGTIDAALAAEKAGQTRCLMSADCWEGVSAWMERREPTFRGQ